MHKEILTKIVRGDVYFADLGQTVGSEQGGVRPVLIVQNDVGNKYSRTVQVAPLTSKQGKSKLPTHIAVKAVESGLPKDSTVLCEQLRTVDKSRLKSWVAFLGVEYMKLVDAGLMESLGIKVA